MKVFISYSHQDDALRQELVTQLAMLRREGKIADWCDRNIEAGEEWETQLKAKLESAEIILLLVSPPFIASDYCYDIEMQRAMERHEEGTARVIPIILRPCDWQGSPFSKLQVLPKDAQPVTRWDDRDSAFLDVVRGIRRAVESMAETSALGQGGQASENRQSGRDHTTVNVNQVQDNAKVIVNHEVNADTVNF